MTPGTIIDVPASCAIRVRIKALKPNTARASLIKRLDTYAGPHEVRKLFKAAAMAIESDASPFIRATVRRQLQNIDKRRDTATKRLAAEAAKALVNA